MPALNKLMFFGDSHTHAVRSAVKKGSHASFYENLDAYRLTKIKNGSLIGDISLDDLKMVCETLTRDDMVVSLVGGNQHSSMSIIQHSVPFYMMTSEEQRVPQEISNTHQIIPRAAVKQHLLDGFRNNDARRIIEVATAGAHHTVHLSSPPPKESADHILKSVETDFLKRGIHDAGVSPASLRLDFWHLQNEVLGEILAEHGIPLLPPPPGTQTSDGYLHLDYYASDATHANTSYGVMVLQQIKYYAEQRVAPVSS